MNAAEQAAAFQLAAYQSRAAKAKGQETTSQLRARWRREAGDCGHHPDEWVRAVLGQLSAAPRTGNGAPKGLRASVEALTSEVISAIERGHSTWGRADVVEALAVRLAPGASTSAEALRKLVERATDELLGHADVVRLGAGLHALVSLPDALRRRDGCEPTARHGAARYTTWRSWQTEQAVLEAVEKGRAAKVAVAPEDAVEAAVKDAELGPDQAESVRRICQGGERVAVMVGPAGSGKSRSLRAARAAWQATGVSVRGVAPSAVAAGVLTEQAGIPSETLAKFLIDASRGRTSLARGEVVVGDEASIGRRNRRGFSNGVCVGKSRAAVPGHYRGLRGLTQMPTTAPCTSACVVRQGSENLVTHRGRRAREQTGVEILASLGVLARWIDEARVEQAYPDPGNWLYSS